jgi:hypothetical protein
MGGLQREPAYLVLGFLSLLLLVAAFVVIYFMLRPNP